ncbi:5'-nucleotidase C-terminal domain-containing protein [Bacillus smithii]|uniref:5'-nucleotidase C-terminal domain-containing protein n=1 Tax=Bacillus smithii TaxID=1479 RepID=UPI0030C8E4EA
MPIISKAYQKFAAAAAASAVFTSVVSPVSAASFTDVTGRYKDAVDFVVSKGAKGLTETSFGVNEYIKRVDAAVLLANVLELNTKDAPDSGFKDVPANAKGAVNALKAAGITSGKTKTTFGSNFYITRGELAIWLKKGFHLMGSSDYSFSDISERYKPAVSALVANKVTKGITPTEFGINHYVKRGDYAIFLHQSYLAKKGKFDLHILHTNDTHAHLDNIARTITAIKQERQEHPNSLLVSAGDVFSGTLYFNEFNGLADLKFMNYIGYDAMTFGNHEFDKGTETLANFVKEADFPFVSANVNFSNDLHLKASSHDEISTQPKDGQIYNGIVKTVNGEKIGIFGLTTAETKDISSPGKDIAFEDYIKSAEKAVDAFKAQGVNKIIALTHIGFNDGGGDNDLTLAKKVEGIDVIVGGHSHDKLEKPVVDTTGEEPTVIVQANEYNKYLGALDVEFDQKGKVVGEDGHLIEIDQKDHDDYVLHDDAEAASLLKPYKEQIDEKKKVIVGNSAAQLDGERTDVRTKETNLGNLITDGMLAKAKTINPNTVIALQNGGGIRDSIDAGPITLAEVQTVMPFGNALAILNLKGSEIKAALEHSVSSVPESSGGFLHVSGLKFTYDSRKPVGQRVLSIQVKGKDGTYQPLNDSENYFVATNTFTAKGGDGYDMFKKASEEGRLSEPGFVDWEIFVDFIEAQPDKLVNPSVEGRIVNIANN